MTARISVILPTVGRETLTAALDSCASADEIVLVCDGGWKPQEPFSANVRVIHVTGRDKGYTARTAGMVAATGTHLAFLDDDDVFTPGAIEVMRAAACDRPVIFQMDHPQHGVIWRDQTLEFGNVGTPMFLVPNVAGSLGVWEPHIPGLPEPGGDFTFIRGCVAKMGEPVWRRHVTSIIRPHERGPSVAVVTPWWNHHELLPDYLAAVTAANPAEIIICDNGGAPHVESAITIGAIDITPISSVETQYANAGFSMACNLGLETSSADAVLFLNNDIQMTSPDWLTRFRAALEPGVLVGAQLRNDPHADVDGERFPYLDGWCVGGMRDDLLELGGFDESFDEPAYWSDNDLSLRARAAGMRLREVRVGLRHKLNVSAADHPNVSAASAANRERYVAAVRELLVPA